MDSAERGRPDRHDAPVTAAPTTIGRAFAPFIPVALALFCIRLDFFALGLALPVIADDFGTTTTDLQWVLSGYMLALGSLMIPASRAADLLGRKRVLLAGIAVFGASSLLCGLSQSALQLEIFRVVQGVGAAMIMPVALTLVTNSTDTSMRPRVLGLMFGLSNIGTALGPIVGGGLAATAGWRWVFIINVPIAAVAIILGARRLTESRDPEGHTLRQMDWSGLALVMVSVGALSLGLDAVSARGATALTPSVLIAVAVVALTLFVFRERRATWPLVSRDLGRRTPFWVLLGGGSFANAGYAMLILIVIIQLQDVRGLSPAVSGLVFLAPALATALCGPISGRLAGRVSPPLVMGVSIALGGVGMVVQALAGSLAVDIVGVTLTALAFGMGYTFTNVATQSVLPESLSSQASGVVLTTMVSLGGVAVVIAAMGLELLGAASDLASATASKLLWTGIVATVVGVVFALVTRCQTPTPT